MKKRKEAAAILLCAVLFITLTYGAGKLLLPVPYEFGAGWDQFLMEEDGSLDVLYFGSSLVYCDVVPAVIWEECGLTSFVMAGSNQTMPITYQYLREACKTQSPQAVVVELGGLFFPRYPDNLRVNLLYMPWGAERVTAAFSALQPEECAQVLFPLCVVHDRVYTVTQQELGLRAFPQSDPYAGYMPSATANLSSRPEPETRDISSEQFFRESLDYLRKISAFCAERDIKLVLYLAPIHYTYSVAAMDTLLQELDTIPHAQFFDCNQNGLFTTEHLEQWRDPLHLNTSGAVPFSRRFALELKALDLTPAPAADTELWRSRAEAVHALLPPAQGGF